MLHRSKPSLLNATHRASQDEPFHLVLTRFYHTSNTTISALQFSEKYTGHCCLTWSSPVFPFSWSQAQYQSPCSDKPQSKILIYTIINCLLLQVPVLYGAAIEGTATCLCRIASNALSEFKPRFSTAIDSFISTSLVVAGERESINSLVENGHELMADIQKRKYLKMNLSEKYCCTGVRSVVIQPTYCAVWSHQYNPPKIIVIVMLSALVCCLNYFYLVICYVNGLYFTLLQNI